MVVATSRPDRYDEGYPRSSEADLDPRPELGESLDDTDRVASDDQELGTHAEVKNSTVGAGTRISHFSCVLDSDVGIAEMAR